MTPTLAPPPPQWKAPTTDGEVLLWPDPATLVAQSHENHASLAASDAPIQNVPLRELRADVRRWLGHPDDKPVIASGHQIELYHPGVWAKDAATTALADRIGGDAVHFAVDTDAPKHLFLKWPGGGEPITDDPYLAKVGWAGAVSSPSPQHVDGIIKGYRAARSTWGFESLAPDFLADTRRGLLESEQLVHLLTNAIHQLDWSLGLKYHATLVSPIWQSRAFLALAYHVLARADHFAATYNSALADYRRTEKIRDPGRPWPDLKVSPDTLEIPFWIDELHTFARRRGHVVRRGDRWALAGCEGDLLFDPALDAFAAADQFAKFLGRCSLRLSPRAMMLTGFLRAFVADQFVHGIGGALYDRVTDSILHRFFAIDPPRFSVTTATLYFPTAVGKQRIDLRAPEQRARHLRHGHDDARKRRLAAAIAAAPRKSTERRRLFSELLARVAELENDPAHLAALRDIDDARRRRDGQKDLFSRELFFALQPRDRLTSLADRYHATFRT